MKVEKLTECMELMKILGDETRLKILCILGSKRLMGVEILKKLDIVQSALSFQMSKLVKSGIVKAEEVWKYTYYTIDQERMKEVVKSFRILNEVAK